MEASISNPIQLSIKRWLFGLSFVLVCASAIGYTYWKANPLITLTTTSSPEQIYYEQLIYAVNEMYNQIERFDSLTREEAFSLAQINKDKTYVNSLMSALTSPPEELWVSQSITDDLYSSYQQYLLHLETGDPLLQASYELATHSYELFRQNADIITVLSAYNGVNVECH